VAQLITQCILTHILQAESFSHLVLAYVHVQNGLLWSRNWPTYKYRSDFYWVPVNILVKFYTFMCKLLRDVMDLKHLFMLQLQSIVWNWHWQTLKNCLVSGLLSRPSNIRNV